MNVIPESLVATKRSKAVVNAYLLLRQGKSVLLSLRKNTGYFDGYFGFISGHIEDGESAKTAVIREAREEANLIISRESLAVVHVMHRKTDRFNIDIFFQCLYWDSELTNLETDKCAELNFFPINNLPKNLIPYIGRVLYATFDNVVYSEEGWEL